MRAEEVADTIVDMRHETIEDAVARCVPARPMSEEWDLVSLHEDALRLSASTCRSPNGPRKKALPTKRSWSASIDTSDRKMAEKAANYGPELMRRGKVACCFRYSTLVEASICCNSIICARVSACVPTPSATRSTNTSAKRLKCSSAMLRRVCARPLPKYVSHARTFASIRRKKAPPQRQAMSDPGEDPGVRHGRRGFRRRKMDIAPAPIQGTARQRSDRPQ